MRTGADTDIRAYLPTFKDCFTRELELSGWWAGRAAVDGIIDDQALDPGIRSGCRQNLDCFAVGISEGYFHIALRTVG